MVDREQVHLAGEAGDFRWLERGIVDRRSDQSKAGPLSSGGCAGRRDGYAAVSEVYDRVGLGFGLRIERQRRRIQGVVRVFAAAQYSCGGEVPGNIDNYRGS